MSNDTDTIQKIQNTLKSTAGVHGGDDTIFMLMQLILCGHTSLEKQAVFLEDAKNRGLLDSEGNLIK